MSRVYLMFILVVLMTAGGCGYYVPIDSIPPEPKNQKVHVVTSFYPLYEFSKNVGGNRVEVYNLIPSGVNVHHWEPTPREMSIISSARVFVCNGAGLEPWVERYMNSINRNKVKVLVASEGVGLISLSEGNDMDEDKHDHERKRHFHPGFDPHIWLDPVIAGQTVQRICDALCDVDPAGKQYYVNRTKSYRSELESLDREFSEAVKGFKNKEFVVTHQAFGYLARRYGLRQIPITGVSAEGEPDPSQMRKIIRFCREHKVKYIFFENLISPRLARAVADEVGACVLVLDPIGGLSPEQKARGDNYVTLMRKNLSNLKRALGGY